jgi:hypothetical protein
MASIPVQSLSDNWQDITITQADIQNLTNTLFEREEPMDIDVLAKVFVATRIKLQEATIAAKIKSLGKVYLPKDSYAAGESLVFPIMDWQSGKVISVRPGVNPQLGSFEVMTVSLENGSEKQFVANLTSHSLNETDQTQPGSSADTIEEILKTYGHDIKASLLGALRRQTELVRIGAAWFPQSLLVDMHKGQLNLVEALLDSQSGGPLSSAELIKEMELKSKDNPKLIEFSLNYALQEDPRFDEVGTSGKYSWFLRKLEPKYVLEKPITLQSVASCQVFSDLPEETQKLFSELNDELAYSRKDLDAATEKDSASIVLNYPHWRAGSLPITPAVMGIFPGAIETEHVKVEFVDDQGQKISAWVVIPDRYVIGLREWFEAQDLIPGSIVEVSKSEQPGVIRIRAEKKRTNKEWIKTLLIGSDNGFVLLLQRQPISAGFYDRMAIKILDLNNLDAIWKDRQAKKIPLVKDILRMANELARLNNQSHVHFTDLYAAVNLVRRVAPHELLQALETYENINYIGDNYYHLAE